MMWPNENPLTPDSLAADGIQGADAKTLGPCEAKHSPQPCGASHGRSMKSPHGVRPALLRAMRRGRHDVAQ
jgi:hypothetical protein